MSVSTTGGYGNGASGGAGISLDGRFVVFDSIATNLVEGITLDVGPGGIPTKQIYIRDLKRQTTELVSVSNSGEPANGYSHSPSISRDGHFVTFLSDATNLSTAVTQPLITHVYLRNRVDGVTALVSKDENGIPFSGGSIDATIRGDGRAVFFTREGLEYNQPFKIFNYNPYHNTIEEFDAGRGIEVPGVHPSASTPAAWIAFVSRRLLPYMKPDGSEPYGPTDLDHNTSTVYLYTTITNTIYPAGLRQKHGLIHSWPDGDSSNPSVNVAGSRVAFDSAASNLLGYYGGLPRRPVDQNDKKDIFVFYQSSYIDEESTPKRVSVSHTGSEANGHSMGPSMSKWQYVAFMSESTNLVRNDNNEKWDIFRHDLNTSETVIISRGGRLGRTESDGDSFGPQIDESGSVISFTSEASNLDESIKGTHGGLRQVYVWRKFFSLIPIKKFKEPIP